MTQRIELRSGVAAIVLLGLLVAMFGLFATLIPRAPLMLRVVFGGIAALFLFVTVALAKRRLVLDETGVTSSGLFGTKTIVWNDVDHYTFWSMDQSMYLYAGGQGAGVAIIAMLVVMAVWRLSRSGKKANARFQQGALRLFTGDGRKIVIDNRYRKAATVLDPAFTELHSRLRARPSRDFAPFSLGEYELVHAKKGSLPLAEVDKVNVAGSRLVVKKRGKKLAWASAGMRTVHNGMLLLEELAERGMIVTPSAGVFVPPTVLGKLTAAASRHAAMPAARVVKR